MLGSEAGERRAVKGRESAWGICPEESPARGSGAWPDHLLISVVISSVGGGACLWKDLPFSTSGVKDEISGIRLDVLLGVFDDLLVGWVE